MERVLASEPEPIQMSFHTSLWILECTPDQVRRSVSRLEGWGSWSS